MGAYRTPRGGGSAAYEWQKCELTANSWLPASVDYPEIVVFPQRTGNP